MFKKKKRKLNDRKYLSKISKKNKNFEKFKVKCGVMLQKYVYKLDYIVFTVMTRMWSQPLKPALVTTPTYTDKM